MNLFMLLLPLPLPSIIRLLLRRCWRMNGRRGPRVRVLVRRRIRIPVPELPARLRGLRSLRRLGWLCAAVRGRIITPAAVVASELTSGLLLGWLRRALLLKRPCPAAIAGLRLRRLSGLRWLRRLRTAVGRPISIAGVTTVTVPAVATVAAFESPSLCWLRSRRSALAARTGPVSGLRL